MVKSITSVSRPFPDGQRVTAVAVEYDCNFTAQQLDASAFSVQGRTITDIYTAASVKSVAPEDGSFIIVELDSADPDSSTITEARDGRHISAPRPPRMDPVGKKGPGGPPTFMLPGGKIFQGPAGNGCLRYPVFMKLRQLTDIQGAPAWEMDMVNDKEYNEWADLFEQRQFEDMSYNIFIPENYDSAKKYPLLLFIHDAGVSGIMPRITLEQGIGATIFASPKEQAKHECIIIAPQHAKTLPIANDQYWCTDDEHTIKRIVDKVISEYSIDTDRIYTTGQSMGFMTSIQLMLDYPGFFTAALLPAGHWDIKKTATLWNEKIWMFLSEEDGGGKRMIAGLPDAIKEIGGEIGIYRWDANIPTAEMSKLVESVNGDGHNFRLAIFPGNSIARPDQPDRTNGGGHNGTWHFVYQIEAARDWLFAQTK